MNTFKFPGKTYIFIFLIWLMLMGCNADDNTVVGISPTITDVIPAYSLPGDVVYIRGANFSDEFSENVVRFNGTPATVIAGSSTELTVQVPEATAGKITLETDAGKAISANDFEILHGFPKAGLVAYYPFFGNAADHSGNDLNGIVDGATLATDRFGKPDQAFEFDGIDDEIIMYDPVQLRLSTQFTIACWVKSGRLTDGMQGIISKVSFDGNPTRGYSINQDRYGDGTPSYAVVLYGNVLTSLYVGQPITTNDWNFVTLVVDGTSFKYYHNNILTHEGTQASPLVNESSPANFLVGSYRGYFFFKGKIDDVTVYNRALNALEVTALFRQTDSKY